MRRFGRSAGFALPTVVIVGTVLFGAMVVVLSSTSSVRTTLDTQFYEALARDAAESGAIHAKDCMNNVGFTVGVTLTPATNCAGAPLANQSAYLIESNSSTPKYRVSYTATVQQADPTGKKATIVAKVEILRSSSNGVWKTYARGAQLQSSLKPDPVGDRASKRFWYFGRGAWLDLGASGNALPTYAPPAGVSGVTNISNEGTTVVNDAQGNLQFYSNGLNIWNKNGATMASDTGNATDNAAALKGAGSATQAVAAFPLNAARTRYGVVSNSGQGETGQGELYLHIIDMTKNNGLGAITKKNQMLGAGLGLGTAKAYNGNNADMSYSGEGIGAMPKADGTGYFVYVYNTFRNMLVTFLINVDGSIAPGSRGWTVTAMGGIQPAKCQVGAFYPSDNGNVPVAGYGYFNFSSDYSKIVMLAGAWNCPNGTSESSSTNGTVYYMSVDGMTGSPTVLASWKTDSSTTTSTRGAYSVDFSPSEQYVYVSQIYPGEIARYSLANLSNVSASKWIIGPTSLTNHPTDGYMYVGGAVKRGPDGRMYVADAAAATYNSASIAQCKMSYIDYPDASTNSAAAIGWKIDALPLNLSSYTTGCSYIGLPQMATVYTPQVTIY